VVWVKSRRGEAVRGVPPHGTAWVYPIRAADALELSAALAAAHGDPSSLAFVSGDARLSAAADVEGFPIT